MIPWPLIDTAVIDSECRLLDTTLIVALVIDTALYEVPCTRVDLVEFKVVEKCEIRGFFRTCPRVKPGGVDDARFVIRSDSDLQFSTNIFRRNFLRSSAAARCFLLSVRSPGLRFFDIFSGKFFSTKHVATK